jgi:hypothetical protein
MSIDWQYIYNHWDRVREADDRNGVELLRIGIDRLIEAMTELYRRYDESVRQMQGSVTTMSRECANLSTILQSLQKQFSAMLRSATLPGGRGLYVFQEISFTRNVVYDPLYDGYILAPVHETYPLRKDPRSQPDLVVGYSTGRAFIEGDVRSLFEASDRAVRVSVVSPGPVSAQPYDLNIPSNYRSGAVVRLDMHLQHPIPYNELLVETDHPVTVLDYGAVSGNYMNRVNNFPDPSATGSWKNASGGSALFEYDDVRGGNALTLVPDTVNALARYEPTNRVYPTGYVSPDALVSRVTYMVYVLYRVVDAPVEATFNIIDDTGRRYLTHTQVLYPRRNFDLITFHGAMPTSGKVGCTISVKRVGARAGRLRVISLNLFEWLWHCSVNMPTGTKFVIPMVYRRNAYTLSVTMALHASEPSEDGQRYYCTLRRLEPRVAIYGSVAEFITPAVIQKTHPITEAVVFVEGENLENSEVVVSADPSFTRTVTIPATQAINGARVEFVPVFGSYRPSSSGYKIPVPLQLASEMFAHGKEFELTHVPYCSALMVRQMMNKFGRYEPNLDLTEVDFDVLTESGTSVSGLVDVVQTNANEWSGSVLGTASTPQETDGYMVLEGDLPAYGGVATDRVDSFDTQMNNMRGVPTIIKDSGGNYLTSWSGVGPFGFGTTWWVVGGSASIVNPLSSVTLGGRTVTNPFNQQALIIYANNGNAVVGNSHRFPIRKGWYRFRAYYKRPGGLSYPGGGIAYSLKVYDSGGNVVDMITLYSGNFTNDSVDVYFEVPKNNADSAELHIIVYLFSTTNFGYAAVTMPSLFPEYPWVSESQNPSTGSSGTLTRTWNIPAHPCFTDTVELPFSVDRCLLSSDHRIRLKGISVQNAVASGSQPHMELFLFKPDGTWVSCGQPLPGGYSGSANSGTWTDITWQVPSGFGTDVPVVWMLIRTIRLNPATTPFEFSVTRNFVIDNSGRHDFIEVIRTRSITNPDDVQVVLSWSGAPITVPEGEALVLSLKLQGFGQRLTFQLNDRVWTEDKVRLRDPEYTGPNSESVVRRANVIIIGDGTPVSTLKVTAHGALGDSEKHFLLGVRKSLRKLSVFNTLVPIKLTVETPFGLFVPDVSGPLPAVGTREVRDERLAQATDQQLEMYEQAVMDGQVAREIRYDRPVYATRFAPIAMHPNGYPILDLALHKRSDGTYVRAITRSEYFLDAERGLIQLKDDLSADYYLVAKYRFKVVSETQIRMYESLIRGVRLTRNRTDYISGLVPQMRSLQFRADEVSGYPIIEYYHQGNKLVLSQEIPPSADGHYTIRADYWYLPVNPAVKLVLRRPEEVRTPVVRRLVLMV